MGTRAQTSMLPGAWTERVVLDLVKCLVVCHGGLARPESRLYSGIHPDRLKPRPHPAQPRRRATSLTDQADDERDASPSRRLGRDAQRDGCGPPGGWANAERASSPDTRPARAQARRHVGATLSATLALARGGIAVIDRADLGREGRAQSDWPGSRRASRVGAGIRAVAIAAVARQPPDGGVVLVSLYFLTWLPVGVLEGQVAFRSGPPASAALVAHQPDGLDSRRGGPTLTVRFQPSARHTETEVLGHWTRVPVEPTRGHLCSGQDARQGVPGRGRGALGVGGPAVDAERRSHLVGTQPANPILGAPIGRPGPVGAVRPPSLFGELR